jgi:hypothetical protein
MATAAHNIQAITILEIIIMGILLAVVVAPLKNMLSV